MTDEDETPTSVSPTLPAKQAVKWAEAYVDATKGIATLYRSQGGWIAELMDRIRLGVYDSRHYSMADRHVAHQTYGADRVDMLHLIVMTAEAARMWERHRIVYRVHPALAESLLESVDEDTAIPCEVFGRLPHPDPFIAFPYAIPAVMDHDPAVPLVGPPVYVGMLLTGRNERGDLVSTADPSLAVLDISIASQLQYVGQGPTYEEQTVRVPVTGKLTIEQMVYHHWQRAGRPIKDPTEDDMQAFELAVSLLLYVCSSHNDLAEPPRPATRKDADKRPGKKATVVDVGFDIGPKLLATRSATTKPSASQSGRTVRPHLRRAHWHTYWTGPRTSPMAEVRWIYPVAVHAEDGDAANAQPSSTLIPSPTWARGAHDELEFVTRRRTGSRTASRSSTPPWLGHEVTEPEQRRLIRDVCARSIDEAEAIEQAKALLGITIC